MSPRQGVRKLGFVYRRMNSNERESKSRQSIDGSSVKVLTVIQSRVNGREPRHCRKTIKVLTIARCGGSASRCEGFAIRHLRTSGFAIESRCSNKFGFRSLNRNSELRSKVLTFGKHQIYLCFRSLNRTFARR